MFEKVLKTTLRSILGETFVADSDYYVRLFVTRFFSNISGLKVDLKFFSTLQCLIILESFKQS